MSVARDSQFSLEQARRKYAISLFHTNEQFYSAALFYNFFSFQENPLRTLQKKKKIQVENPFQTELVRNLITFSETIICFCAISFIRTFIALQMSALKAMDRRRDNVVCATRNYY